MNSVELKGHAEKHWPLVQTVCIAGLLIMGGLGIGVPVGQYLESRKTVGYVEQVRVGYNEAAAIRMEQLKHCIAGTQSAVQQAAKATDTAAGAVGQAAEAAKDAAIAVKTATGTPRTEIER